MAPTAPPAPPAPPVQTYAAPPAPPAPPVQTYAAPPAPPAQTYAAPQPAVAIGAPLYPNGQASQAGGSKNALGVMSLIAPFVCLAPVGIVLGHMGLSAVKKGKATNKGVALAGTILSWFVTLVGIPVFFLSLLPLFMSSDGSSGGSVNTSDVDKDLRAIQAEVESVISETSALPVVSLDGGSYLVGESSVPASADVDTAALVGDLDRGYYCVELWWGDSVRTLDQAGTFADKPCSVLGGGGGAIDIGQGSDEDTGESQAPADVTVDTSTIQVGTCILDPYDDAVQQEDGSFGFNGFTFVDCQETHYGEFFAVGQSQLADFDAAALDSEASEMCLVQFEPYVGTPYDSSEFYVDYWYPSADTWAAGDRELICSLHSMTGDLQGSMQGSGR